MIPDADECSQDSLDFGAVAGRRLWLASMAGPSTSDAGALLLGQAAWAIGLVTQLAACFIDARAPELIEHSLETLVGQRLFGLALGYEDLNDHDHLRHDLGAAIGRRRPKAGDTLAHGGRCVGLARQLHSRLCHLCLLWRVLHLQAFAARTDRRGEAHSGPTGSRPLAYAGSKESATGAGLRTGG